MEVEIFAICDFASVDTGGKLNLVGIFDAIEASETPLLHGLCALAAKIKYERREEGSKRVRFAFFKIDGTEVIPPIELSVPLKIRTPRLDVAKAHIIAILPRLKLPDFGEYEILLQVEGVQVSAIQLSARLFGKPT